MAATWIVSANAGRAKILSRTQGVQDLEEVTDMVNPAIHLRTSETESDKIGPHAAAKSIHNTGGALPNSQYEPQQTPDERQSEAFAKDIVGYLKSGLQDGSFQQLDLIASPEFLGLLRKQMDKQLSDVVNLELNKDYTNLSAKELREQLQANKEKA